MAEKKYKQVPEEIISEQSYECPADIREVIEKWKISKTILAEKMGLPRSTFANKYSEKHYLLFTYDEILRFQKALKELVDDVLSTIWKYPMASE